MKQFKLNYDYNVKNDLKAEISSENHGISIAGEDEKKVQVEIIMEVKNDNIKQEEIEKLISCEYNKKENYLNLETKESEVIKNMKINLITPKKTNIIGKTENGPISIIKLIGTHKITSENGPISIADNQGEIQVESENGPIAIKENTGNINIQFENGPLSLRDCKGKMKIVTENSPIKCGNCQGELYLKTENSSVKILSANFETADIKCQNGTIYYEFKDVEEGKFNFQNKMGGIHLVIPEGTPYQIAAKNKLGKFYVGLKGDYDGLDKGLNVGDDKNLDMVYGAGTVEISAENEFGTIRFVDTVKSKKTFDFSFVNDIIDKSMKSVPNEYSDAVKKSLESAKEAVKNIEIPNIPEIMEDVQQKMKDVMRNINTDDIKEETEEKINEGITKVFQEVHERIKDKDLSQKEQDTVNERSRLKILQMLSEGKLTAQEAEKLISAMEG